MPRLCRVCHHPERETIDRQIVHGRAITDLSKKFSLPETNLRRHRKHIIKTLVVAREEREMGINLTQELANLQQDALRLQAEAEKAKDRRGAIAALRERARIAEILARIEGRIPGAQTNVLSLHLERLDPETAQRMARAVLDQRRLLEGTRTIDAISE